MRPGLLKTALLLIAIGCLAAGCNRAVHVKSNGRRAVIALMDSAESVMNDGFGLYLHHHIQFLHCFINGSSNIYIKKDEDYKNFFSNKLACTMFK